MLTKKTETTISIEGGNWCSLLIILVLFGVDAALLLVLHLLTR